MCEKHVPIHVFFELNFYIGQTREAEALLNTVVRRTRKVILIVCESFVRILLPRDLPKK